MGHYTINADPSELTVAEKHFASLSDNLGPSGEGGKLSRSHGNTEGWSGKAATSVLAEMGRIATGMTTYAPKFTDAHDAVHTFRIALHNAMDDDLVKLNKRWSDADDAYNTAVKKANTTYDGATKPDSGTPVSDGDQKDATDAKNKATTSAGSTRTTTRAAIDADYDTLVTSLKTAAQKCGTAMASAAPFAFTHEQWEKVKGGGPIPPDLFKQMRIAALGKESFVGFIDAEGGGEWEKPEWLETTEKALKPLEGSYWAMDTTAFALFNSTAGGGIKDLFTNGKLWDLYSEDGLRGAANWERGLTGPEVAGTSFSDATKLLDGRALGSLFAEGSKASSLVGKVGVLGPISLAVGGVSVGYDIAHGDTKAAIHDGVSTALTAGALFAPPPADLVCGAGALAMAAYDNIPAVHDAANWVGHKVGGAAKSLWHATCSLF